MKGFASFLTAAVLSAFGGGATTTAPTVPQKCVTISRTLDVGSTGADVKALQQFLGVSPTSYFGPLTKKKLTDWQLAQKIITSTKTAGAGTTGPKTRKALSCAPISASIVAPLASTSSPASASTSSPSVATSSAVQVAPAPIPVSGGGGGGSGGVSPYGYTCADVGAKPAADTCTTGIWELQFDEAGCTVWACTYDDDRG